MNYIDLIFIAVIVAFTIAGLIKGLFSQAIFIFSLIISWIYTNSLYPFYTYLLQNKFGIKEGLAYYVPILSFISIFLASVIILKLLLFILEKIIGGIGFINHLLGGLFALIMSIYLLVIISIAIDNIFPIKTAEDPRISSKLYYPIKDILEPNQCYISYISFINSIDKAK